MRSLFDDTKNPVFRLLCQIVDEIHAGAKLTRNEILQRIFSLPEFIYVEAPEKIREKQIVDEVFNFTRAGFAEIPSGKKFSLPITDTELAWLKAVLSDAEFAFLLPADLREKLLRCLKDSPSLYEKNFWRKLRADKTNSAGEKFFDVLSMIIDSLRLQRKIFVNGELLTPCRLEYDLAADKFSLIVWLEDVRTVKKIPVENVNNFSLSDESAPPDTDELLKNFYAEHVAEVSLEVRNTRNAVERCFALFGSFDKKARLRDDGTYFMTISYCTLDEAEVFDKIFSLGATATVIAPKDFRERVIKKFAAIKNLYE